MRYGTVWFVRRGRSAVVRCEDDTLLAVIIGMLVLDRSSDLLEWRSWESPMTLCGSTASLPDLWSRHEFDAEPLSSLRTYTTH